MKKAESREGQTMRNDLRGNSGHTEDPGVFRCHRSKGAEVLGIQNRPGSPDKQKGRRPHQGLGRLSLGNRRRRETDRTVRLEQHASLKTGGKDVMTGREKENF